MQRFVVLCLKFLRDRPTIIEGPRSMGSALKGSKLGEFWKYHVGDYRVMCRSEDQRLRILAAKGNRSPARNIIRLAYLTPVRVGRSLEFSCTFARARVGWAAAAAGRGFHHRGRFG